MMPKSLFSKLKNIKWNRDLFVYLSLILIPFLAYTFLFILPKNPAFRKAKQDSNYIFIADGQDFDLQVGLKDGNHPQVDFKTDSGQVTFSIKGLEFVELTTPQKEKRDTVSFRDVQNNIDLRYTTLENGIKEEIILNERGTRNTFWFDLDIEGAHIEPISEGFVDPVLYDEDGNYLFHFVKPYAYDEAGVETEEVSIQLLERENGFLVEVSINREWLDDKEREYPVYIDPTIVHDTTGEFALGEFNRNRDVGSPQVESYYQPLSADQHTVGLWHMDEGNPDQCTGGSNDVCDSSGNGNDGYLVGNAGFTASSRIGDYATTFDAANSTHINLGTSGDLQFAYDDTFTIEAWININSFTKPYSKILNQATSANTFQYILNTDSSGNTLQFGVCEAQVACSAAVTPFSALTDTWYHMAATYDGTTASLYIDGELVSTILYTFGALPPPNAATYLGGGTHDGNDPFDGQIDEVRISNVSRTPEEIYESAMRSRYSVFTSSVLDLTTAPTVWNSLSWSESGVSTGDGETVFDDTGLIAQWNFNETSGTTANNDAEGSSCGGTPANCDGTLTGFDSTASQDADPDSSWTGEYKKWGAGALMFDGVDSYMSAASSSIFDASTAMTFGGWIKTAGSGEDDIILGRFGNSSGTSTNAQYDLTVRANGMLGVQWRDDVDGIGQNEESTTYVADSQWHYVVAQREGSTIRLFSDGQKVFETTLTETGAYTFDDPFVIGVLNAGPQYEFKGVMDSMFIYSRALPASEILSNYNSSNIQFQTRVGADTTPNDGSWDNWDPTSVEDLIEGFEYPYLYDTTDTDLISYWPMDEVADNSCSGGEDACDINSTNHIIDSGGSTIVDGAFANARTFDGTNDYLSLSSSPNTATTNWAIEAWIKPANLSQLGMVMYNSNDTGGYGFGIGNGGGSAGNKLTGLFGAVAWIDSGYTFPNANSWYHVVMTRDTGTTRFYINGVQTANTSSATPAAVASKFNIGNMLTTSNTPYRYFAGDIDEVRFYSDTLTATEVQAQYLIGNPTAQGINLGLDSIILTQGTYAKKIALGITKIDSSVVGHWNMDETNGEHAGADIFDSGLNGINGEIFGSGLPTGVTEGIKGKSRDFNGTDDYIFYSSSGFDLPNMTTSVWVRTEDMAISQWITTATNSGASRNFATLALQSDGTIRHFMRTGTSSSTNVLDAWTSDTPIETDRWYHIVSTMGSTGNRIYIDGELKSLTYLTGNSSTTNSWDDLAGGGGAQELFLGTYYYDGVPHNYFNGQIDEASVFNRQLDAEEISDLYQMGRGEEISISIPTADLSNKSLYAIDVASDRTGTFLESRIGEDGYTNYIPDTNTVGYWKFDELTNNACNSGSNDVCDSSGNNNHGNENNTVPIVSGIRSLARDFNASNDYISVASPSVPTGNSQYTIEAWIKPDAMGDYGIVGWGNYGSTNQVNALRLTASGIRHYWWGNDVNVTIALADGKWHHIVALFDGTNRKIYADSKEVFSDTPTGHNVTTTNNFRIGSTNNAEYFNGNIDEVRVSDIGRTPTEIRQAYEIGLRTHPITIDFGASLDSGNLISNSSDYSFTIDATTRGLTEKGSHLLTGDKIIIKENVDGTEYIAQGTVTTITQATGVTTVSSWDSGATFPSSGYTANATVFKWQTEYVDLSQIGADDNNAITNLTYRITNGFEGREIWLDNVRSVSNYLTNQAGSTITSALGSRYFQYRAILSSTDGDISASLSSLTLDYTNNLAPTTPIISGPLLPSNLKTSNTSPTVNFISTEPDLEDLTYQIQWDTDSNFASAITKTSSAHGGFANVDNSGDTDPFTQNQTVSYTWQIVLTDTTTYFYHVRAFDGVEYSDWSETRSLTIDTGADRNSWYQTHADQFSEGTPGGNINIDGTSDSVKVTTGTDTLMSPIITAANFDTALRWGVASFSDVETTGSVIYKIYYDVTGTPTIVPDGVLTGNSSGFGSSPIDLSALDVATYPSIYIEASLTYSAGSPELQDWEVSLNKTPNIPIQEQPTDGDRPTSLTPILRTTATDNDGDWLRYKIDLCLNRSMNIGCQTFDQTISQTGWIGQNTQSTTAYNSGSQAVYIIQTPLTAGTLYYWRSYATDPAGESEWSNTQSDPFWFMTNSTPRSASPDTYEHYASRSVSDTISSTPGWAPVTGTADAGTSSSTNGWIDSTNLTVGDRYLIMTWGTHNTNNTASRSGLRVSHGGTSFVESETVEETDRASTAYKTPYFWFTVWTAVSGEDLEMDIYWDNTAGTQAQIEDLTLIAINAEDLIASGALQYSIDTIGGALTSGSLSTVETLDITSSTTQRWLTLGYMRWDINTVSAQVQARLDINGTDLNYSRIDGEDTNDTPLYGFGSISELGASPTVSIESGIESGASSSLGEGIMSLNLNAFEQVSFDTKFTPHEIASGTSTWEEILTTDLMTNISTSWMHIGGSLIDDNGERVLSRLQNNDTNLTDDIGGWQHLDDNIIPNTQFDLTLSNSGTKHVDYDLQRTLNGASRAQSLDPWLIGISLEKYNTGTRRDAPSAGATNQSVLPAFQLTSTDPDGDKIRYKMDLCEDSNMTLNCQTFDQTSSQTGWSGQDSLAATAYNPGSTATYTVSTALSYNTTYHWKSYAKDNSTQGVWTTEQTGPYSFTTTQQPSIPSSLEAEQQTNPTGVDDTTPEFSAIYSDPDGDSGLFYQIEVNTNATFTGTTMWDSTKTSTNVANGNRSSLYVYNGSALAFNGTTYYWRIRFWDGNEAVSNWSSTAQFSTAILNSPAPCKLEEATDDSQITITWVDLNTIEDSYEIERSVNGGSFTALISKLANTTSHIDSTISQGNTYSYRLFTKKGTAVSDYCLTSTLDLQLGNFQFGGLNLEGIKID